VPVPRDRSGRRVLVAVAAVTCASAQTSSAIAAVAQPGVLSAGDCAGKPKGQIVRWYRLGGSPFATIPLRCGEKNGFGLLKILHKHPENAPILDENISDTLINYDHQQQQSPTSVAYSRSDLAPCPGHFRVVVQFKAYGSTGMQGIITAFHSPDPAAGEVRPHATSC
jgi:hypothetical protein